MVKNPRRRVNERRPGARTPLVARWCRGTGPETDHPDIGRSSVLVRVMDQGPHLGIRGWLDRVDLGSTHH